MAEPVAILNIGLKSNVTGEEISRKQLLQALENLPVCYLRIAESKNTEYPERTAIVHLETLPFWAMHKICQLSNNCEQDCISVYYPKSKSGFLFGPNATAWGGNLILITSRSTKNINQFALARISGLFLACW